MSTKKLQILGSLGSNITLDKTLAIEGQAADSKAVGDEIAGIHELIGDASVSEQIDVALASSVIQSGEYETAGVLNDTKTNKAIAPYSTAAGLRSRTGIYGYRLLAVSTNEDGTRNATVDDVNLELKARYAYAVGDNLCLDGIGHYYDTLTISGFGQDESTGNSIITFSLSERTQQPEMIDIELANIDNRYADLENWVYVFEKPDCGIPVLASTTSYVSGLENISVGHGAVALGEGNIALGSCAYAEGMGNKALYAAHAEGKGNLATGHTSHAEGYCTQAIEHYTHAEGFKTIANAYYAHAEGRESIAEGSAAHAEGVLTKATKDYAHAEGYKSESSGNASHAEGIETVASGGASHSEGGKTKTIGNYSHAEGYLSEAQVNYAHAEGYQSIASGTISHAEGRMTTASGQNSHSEGNTTTASGNNSHAEGNKTIASSAYAHAEGNTTEASNTAAHAEGEGSKATGGWSHAEGYYTTSAGTTAHSEGRDTIASGYAAHAEGRGTIVTGSYQHVQGKWNIEDVNNKYAHIVGNGTSTDARSNAHTLDWNGNAWFAGDVFVGANNEVLAKKSETAPAGFGLGTGSTFVSDANNAILHGWYYSNVNTPTSDWWDIFVPSSLSANGHDDYSVKQFAFNRYNSTPEFYFRSKGGAGSWSDWVKFSSTAAVTSVNGKTGAVSLAASDIGAIPQQCAYVSTAVSADTITAPFVLLNISSENTELQMLLGNANYAYLQTQYYNSVNGWRMQVAWSYAIDPPKMAFRTEYQGVWSSWTSPSASDTPTYPYVIAETTVSNLHMHQLNATNTNDILATYNFDYTCRKWSNGIIEIFGRSKGSTSGALSEVTTSTAIKWGSLYETGAFVLPSYPETLKTCTYANVSFASTSGNVVWAEGGHWGGVTSPGNVYFCRATEGNGLDDVKGNICVYTVGTWK